MSLQYVRESVDDGVVYRLRGYWQSGHVQVAYDATAGREGWRAISADGRPLGPVRPHIQEALADLAARLRTGA